MTSLFFSVLEFILKVFLFILGACAALSVPFFISGLIWFIHYYRSGRRFKKRRYNSKYVKRSLLTRLLYDFPRRVVLDMFGKDPDKFPYCGNIMVVGEQGSGKTVTTAYICLVLKKLFPKVKITSNTPLSFGDGIITGPDDIILNDNGKFGCVKVLDEIQNWFNSAESQYFPPEMLSEISQQRKQHSIIIGTTQCFDRISKAIRQQTHFLVKPITILGSLTIVRVYKPTVNEDGSIEKLRRIKVFCFVQTDEVRDCFDTYAKIKRLSVKGWVPRSDQLKPDSNSNLVVNVPDKRSRR